MPQHETTTKKGMTNETYKICTLNSFTMWNGMQCEWKCYVNMNLWANMSYIYHFHHQRQKCLFCGAFHGI